MEYLENNNIKNEVIDKLIDKLYDYEGIKCYSCDLAYTLFESYNADGSVTYSTNEAQKWIKDNWKDLPDILEELKFQFGNDYFSEILMDIFENPEKFMVVIYLEVSSYLIGKCKLIEDNWDNEIVLTKKNINTIKKQLEEMRG